MDEYSDALESNTPEEDAHVVNAEMGEASGNSNGAEGSGAHPVANKDNGESSAGKKSKFTEGGHELKALVPQDPHSSSAGQAVSSWV